MYRLVSSLFFIAAALAGLAAAVQAEQPASLISRTNGSIGFFGGSGGIGSGAGLAYWLNTNNGQHGQPDDPCLLINLCEILGTSGGRSTGATYGGEMFLSFPIGHMVAMQIDGTYGNAAGNRASLGRIHLFSGWPGQGTAGPFYQHMSLGSAGQHRAGGEGQIWFERISFYANAGYQWGGGSHRFTLDKGLFACGEARWYPTDSLAIGVGGGFGPTRMAAFAGGELQMPGGLRDLSLFAHGAAGEDKFYSMTLGARWHFGSGGTLLARHRQETVLPYAACGLEQFDGVEFGLYYQNAG